MQSHAIKVMKREMNRLQTALNDCIDECGYVRNEYKYRYQMLMEQVQAFKLSIEYLEQLYNIV